MFVHLGSVKEGQFSVQDRVGLYVTEKRRAAVARNHSATHLLHWALREVLGDHVTQRSRVQDDRLRFDFAHFSPLSNDERRQVEQLVNAQILQNTPTQTDVLSISEAKDRGAMAVFGEKYGDKVRMLTIGTSIELCGGTHVSRTGDIGPFVIADEGGVAQGVRRIEALTGAGALFHINGLRDVLSATAASLKVAPNDVAGRLDRLQNDLKEKNREIESLRAKLASGGGQDLVAQAETVGDIRVLVADVGVDDPKILRETIDGLRTKMDLVSSYCWALARRSWPWHAP